MGDAAFYANSLHLAHWASKDPCFECDCKSSPGNLSKWVKNIDVATQDFCVVSNQEPAGLICFSIEFLDSLQSLCEETPRTSHGCMGWCRTSWAVCFSICVGTTTLPSKRNLQLIAWPWCGGRFKMPTNCSRAQPGSATCASPCSLTRSGLIHPTLP